MSVTKSLLVLLTLLLLVCSLTRIHFSFRAFPFFNLGARVGVDDGWITGGRGGLAVGQVFVGCGGCVGAGGVLAGEGGGGAGIVLAYKASL